MSYDVFAWSRSPSIPLVTDLGPHLGRWSIAPLALGGTRALPTGRPWPAASLVVGWRRRRGLADVLAILRSRDEAMLQSLYDRGLLASCTLNVERRYRMDPEEMEELAELRTPRQLATLRAARVHYVTSSRAGRNDLSIDLQTALCVALARVHGGLVEDPQTDRVRLFEPA